MTSIASRCAVLKQSPAVQALRQRVEQGGVLSCSTIHAGAYPFLAVLLRHLFPTRPVIVVANGLRTQEAIQQDTETWLQVADSRLKPEATGNLHAANRLPFFYPSWQILPHEPKLPHIDVISERLETLIALLPFVQSEITDGPSAAAPT